MKSTELMVYDWVSFDLFGGEITKIAQVSGVYDTGEVFTDGCGCTYDANPIPITEEILKANGFNNRTMETVFFKGTTYGVLKYKKSDWEIRYNIDKNKLSITTWDKGCIQKIYYVHELQQAMRLCGLNELADNFKLK